MGTVNLAIEWIQAQMRVLGGIRKAYPWPIGKIIGGITALAYSPEGLIKAASPVGARTDFHIVVIQIQTPIKDISRDYERLSPYIERAATVIVSDLTWGGTVTSIAAPDEITYTLAPITWNAQDFLALRFSVPIKIKQT